MFRGKLLLGDVSQGKADTWANFLVTNAACLKQLTDYLRLRTILLLSSHKLLAVVIVSVTGICLCT
jgi:hypothetical protein